MTDHHNPFASGVSLGPTPTIPILDADAIKAREAAKARHPSSQATERATGYLAGDTAQFVEYADVIEEPSPPGMTVIDLDPNIITGRTDLYIYSLAVREDGRYVAEVLIPEMSPHFTFQLPIEIFGEVCRYFFTNGTSLATNPVMHIKGLGAAIDGKPTFGGVYEWVDNVLPNMVNYINVSEVSEPLHSV